MKKVKNHSPLFIMNVRKESDEQIIRLREDLKALFGPVTLRGRHSDRRSVLGERYKEPYNGNHRGNDVPWRLSETVSFYKRYSPIRICEESMEVTTEGGLVHRRIYNRNKVELIGTERRMFTIPLN